MVILGEKFAKLHVKLENLHHHHRGENEEALSAAFRDFRSKVSASFKQLLLNSKPGSGVLSSSWIKKGFELVETVNSRFAWLIVEINYPMSSWESTSADEFLNYSLFKLDSLNSISSGISRLSHSRLLLLNSLNQRDTSSSVVIEPLKPIEVKISFKYKADDGKSRYCSRKEAVTLEALTLVKTIVFWVFGVVLSGLVGDPGPYKKIQKLVSGYSGSLFEGLDTSEFEASLEKGIVFQGVKDVNDAVGSLDSVVTVERSEESTEILREELVKFEIVMGEIETMVNRLFSKTISERDVMMKTLRLG